MDNYSDNTISFDEHGVCNYCRDAINKRKTQYFPDEVGKQKVEQMIRRLKSEGKGKDYDCLMGISGGLDSAYLAYLGAIKWGLRICAIHVDDGFDTDLAKRNIINLCEKCNIELKVIKPDAEQFNGLTRAYFLAEVPNTAIPQDNILFACLYDYARKYKIFNFLTGGNYALECILQRGNTYGAYDLVNLRDIHKKFGQKPIDKLPFISQWQRVWDVNIHHIKTIAPLNYIDYNKEKAIKELYDFCGFSYYEAKHLENTLTKVIQLYWFYHKFNVDKRTSHLSSLIVSGQMTREQALEELSKPLYDKEKMDKDLDIVLPKLGFTRKEFDEIVFRPGKQHTEYKVDKAFVICQVLHKLHLIKF
jgi:N-acetyl sugar amidotransferase